MRLTKPSEKHTTGHHITSHWFSRTFYNKCIQPRRYYPKSVKTEVTENIQILDSF